MAEKKIKTRIQHKRGTAAEWAAAGQHGFTPLAGELIIYVKDSADGQDAAAYGRASQARRRGGRHRLRDHPLSGGTHEGTIPHAVNCRGGKLPLDVTDTE